MVSTQSILSTCSLESGSRVPRAGHAVRSSLVTPCRREPRSVQKLRSGSRLIYRDENSELHMKLESGSSAFVARERQAEIETGAAKVRARSRRGSLTAGNAITEFAVVVPLFFLLVFAVVDMASLFYAQTTLQDAVREAGRYAITGQHQPDPKNPGGSLSRVNSIIAVAQQQAMGLNISNIQISSVTGGSGSAGGPGDTVVISLTSNVQLLTPFLSQFFKNGAYTFTVSTRFKNESFPPDQTN